VALGRDLAAQEVAKGASNFLMVGFPCGVRVTVHLPGVCRRFKLTFITEWIPLMGTCSRPAY